MATGSRMAGKVALVSGAGSGLGAETARRLAEEGATVAVTDLRPAAADAVSGQIRAAGGRAQSMMLDVVNESLWRRAIERTEREFGKLDVLVNNAGTAEGTWIHKLTLEQWRRVQSINLDGVFLGIKIAAEAMQRAGGGSIVNISSVAGLVGIGRGASAYCASKGGVTLLTRAAALEFAELKRNIRVNSVHPGFMQTPMLEGVISASRDPDTARQAMIDGEPLGRLGEPADIANAVLYLASDESKFVTGSQLVVDGGYYAR